ncbi:MAG: hypothetical protein U0175_34440 [Caldilineaceae bacterium]
MKTFLAVLFAATMAALLTTGAIIHIYPNLAYTQPCYRAITDRYSVNEFSKPGTYMHMGQSTVIFGFVAIDRKQYEYSCTVQAFGVTKLEVEDNVLFRAWATGEVSR